MSDLWSALCLVAILEGLFLFAAPGGWKRTAEQLHALPNERLVAPAPRATIHSGWTVLPRYENK